MTMSCFWIVSAISGGLLALVSRRTSSRAVAAEVSACLVSSSSTRRTWRRGSRPAPWSRGRTSVAETIAPERRAVAMAQAGDADAHDEDAGRRHGAGGLIIIGSTRP